MHARYFRWRLSRIRGCCQRMLESLFFFFFLFSGAQKAFLFSLLGISVCLGSFFSSFFSQLKKKSGVVDFFLTFPGIPKLSSSFLCRILEKSGCWKEGERKNKRFHQRDCLLSYFAWSAKSASQAKQSFLLGRNTRLICERSSNQLGKFNEISLKNSERRQNFTYFITKTVVKIVQEIKRSLSLLLVHVGSNRNGQQWSWPLSSTPVMQTSMLPRRRARRCTET